MSASSLTPLALLSSYPEGSPVEVGGWLTHARFSKRVAFLVLSDGSTLQPVQVVLSRELIEAQPELASLGTGCSVRVKGTWVASVGAGQSHEVHAHEVQMVGGVKDPHTYPLQPKEHSVEFLRSVPHLRARMPAQAAVMRLRHVLMRAVHDYFDRKGFVWAATPILTDSDAEGAGERLEVKGPAGFFAQPTYLTVSGQLEAEAQCAAMSRVYTFGPTFRAEGSHTSRHLAEFWMIEPEWAFATLPDLIGLAEGLLKQCVGAALERMPQEMAHFSGGSVAQWEQFVEQPFEVMSYTDAVAQLQKHEGFERGVQWGMDLGSEHEKWLVAQVGRPVVVVDYPTDIKSFYMRASDDGRTVQAMDILVPGMGEIVGGSVREERLAPLLARMEALGMDTGMYRHYLDLRRYGSVPHGGFGLGFERLVAYLAQLSSVKEAIAYPRFAAG